MKKFIRVKNSEINRQTIVNEVVNMKFVEYFYTLERKFENFTRYDVVFTIKERDVNWSFGEKSERDRVFKKIKEDFSYEI